MNGIIVRDSCRSTDKCVSALCRYDAVYLFCGAQSSLSGEGADCTNQITNGDTEGVSSIITLTEVLTLPIRLRKTELEQAYRQILLQGKNFQLIPIDEAIASRAAHLRAQYNLKTPDALQIATAVESGCEAFLTNDMTIKRVQEIKILVLDELELS